VNTQQPAGWPGGAVASASGAAPRDLGQGRRRRGRRSRRSQ